MVFAWRVENEVCSMLIRIMIPVDHRGMTLRRDLTDSTSSTEQRLHGFEVDPSEFKSLLGSLIMQALFRHLQTEIK